MTLLLLLLAGFAHTNAALALPTRLFEGSFGPDGTSSTTFEHAAAIGVDSSTGVTYVADKPAGTVQRFNAAHEPEPFTGLAPNIVLGKLTGFAFSSSPAVSELAVDPASHNFYVADLEANTVTAFQSDGEPALFSAGPGSGTNELAGSEPCGVAVDSNGAVYVSFASGVHVFAPTGEELTSFSAGVPCNLAVDSHGTVYAAQFGGGVRRLAPSEFPVTGSTSWEEAPAPVDEERSTAVAVDPSTDTVFVDEGTQVAEYDPAGKRLGVFATTGGEGAVSASEGLAVNTTTGKIYVTDAEGEQRVGIFAPQPPPRPVITEATASNLTKETADLSVKVNPGGLDTTCSFEYGTDTGYANPPLPCTPQPGKGTGDVTITQHIEKLAPDRLYHWRLVATNAAGTTTGVDHTFIYPTAGGGLPDGRAYEMVTPPFKNAALFGNVFAGLQPDISANGSRLILSTTQCFGDAESCRAVRDGVGSGYAFSRERGNWVAHALAPPATQFEVSSVQNANADTGAALVSAPTPPHGQDDYYIRQLDGSMTDIGPVSPPELGAQGANGNAHFATADFSHLITMGTNTGWPGDGLTGGTFEYAGSGLSGPLPVGVSGGPGGTSLISFCATLVGSAAEVTGASSSAMSADGETVFFTARRCLEPEAKGHPEVPVNEVYARLGQAETAKLSEGECGAGPAQDEVECRAASPADAEFQGASVDGTRALLTSPQQLTDSATQDSSTADNEENKHCREMVASGCNLYEYDFSKPVGQRLVTVSAGDTSGGGPRVQGVLASSNDGSHVYFVARGVLSATANGEGAKAKAGAPNLYLFERDAAHPTGTTTFIATLSDNANLLAADKVSWFHGPNEANVSSDGRFLVFYSQAPLTKDDTRPDGGGRQIFRYDAETNELLRVSVGQDGFNDNGNGGVGNAYIAGALASMQFAGGSGRRDPSMSDDGSRVFFMSPVALTRGALNDVPTGENNGRTEFAQNVYEWEQPGAGSCAADRSSGCVSLISDGRDVDPLNSQICGALLSAICLVGTDSTGSNVFFATADQLVPGDTDTQVDFYDARICSSGDPCIKGAPAPLPGCSGEACHGVPPATPAAPDAPSATFNGAGNATPPPPGGPPRPACSSSLGAPAKGCTRRQNLTKALATCGRHFPHSRKKRASCVRQAHARYATRSRSSGSSGHGSRH